MKLIKFYLGCLRGEGGTWMALLAWWLIVLAIANFVIQYIIVKKLT